MTYGPALSNAILERPQESLPRPKTRLHPEKILATLEQILGQLRAKIWAMRSDGSTPDGPKSSVNVMLHATPVVKCSPSASMAITRVAASATGHDRYPA